jgi:hypothetical protein
MSADTKAIITVGLYPDGSRARLFITMAKEGSTVSGLMDSFACAVSIALQHGVPLKLLCEKFAHTRFEPSGWSGNPDIGYAKSIMDYIFRWLQLRFLTGQQQALFESRMDSDLCPAALRSWPAVHVEYKAKIIQHALDNFPGQYKQIHASASNDWYFYNDDIYRQLGL